MTIEKHGSGWLIDIRVRTPDGRVSRLRRVVYGLLRNPDDDDPLHWVTIQVDSGVFDAEKGKEAALRGMVNTVGRKGMAGEHVRCIVSVNMLSEGWDVKSVTHIIGLRAFGSPLLTEQIIGRGLRRTDYDVLNQPLSERPPESDETVDAFGIPFVGFPVQRRKRPKAGDWSHKAVSVQREEAKSAFDVRIPNVRSWAVGVTRSLSEVIHVRELPTLVVDPRAAPPEVHMKPVVGGKPESVMTLEEFRRENPLMRTVFRAAGELLDAMTTDLPEGVQVGPTFEELLDVVREYMDCRVSATGDAERRDVGIYFWRRKLLDVLETSVRDSAAGGIRPVPILGDPEWLDTQSQRRFSWTGITAEGKKAPTNVVACHTDLEKRFADFLDAASDVARYHKNERFGFSVTYYENHRPRQYFPDFVVAVKEPAGGREVLWVCETKGEIRPNTALKRKAATDWCDKMSQTRLGRYRHLFVEQKRFETAMNAGIATFADLVEDLTRSHLRFLPMDHARASAAAFKTALPLYSLHAAAGYFGAGEAVEQEGWLEVKDIGKLDTKMFVAQVHGRSMEPRINDGDYCVFRSDQVPSDGDIVLAQYRGPADPETGGAYTVTGV